MSNKRKPGGLRYVVDRRRLGVTGKHVRPISGRLRVQLLEAAYTAMNAKRSSAWVLNSVLASSSLAIAAQETAYGVVAERHRRLIVDQEHASSNLVDPADVLNAGVAERNEAPLF